MYSGQLTGHRKRKVLSILVFSQMAVAKRSHDLTPNGGPNLEPGFHLSGKLTVLGIETDAALSLLPREVRD